LVFTERKILEKKNLWIQKGDNSIFLIFKPIFIAKLNYPDVPQNDLTLKISFSTFSSYGYCGIRDTDTACEIRQNFFV